MPMFLRITGLVALGLVALIVVGFVLKIVLFAAIVAALVVGCLALVRVFRGRRSAPLTISVRR